MDSKCFVKFLVFGLAVVRHSGQKVGLTFEECGASAASAANVRAVAGARASATAGCTNVASSPRTSTIPSPSQISARYPTTYPTQYQPQALLQSPINLDDEKRYPPFSLFTLLIPHLLTSSPRALLPDPKDFIMSSMDGQPPPLNQSDS
jgi:hypothetical protein